MGGIPSPTHFATSQMRISFLSKSYQSIALFLRARDEVDSPSDLPELHELEQRIFYDASPLGAVLDDLTDSPEHVEIDEVEPLNQFDEMATEDFSYAPDWEQAEQQVSEVVFIDRNVEGYNLLLQDLASQNGVAVYLLDSDSDGVEQITETLRQYTQLSAVHIVSHGDEGYFEVGSEHRIARQLRFVFKPNFSMGAIPFCRCGPANLRM